MSDDCFSNGYHYHRFSPSNSPIISNYQPCSNNNDLFDQNHHIGGVFEDMVDENQPSFPQPSQHPVSLQHSPTPSIINKHSFPHNQQTEIQSSELDNNDMVSPFVLPLPIHQSHSEILRQSLPISMQPIASEYLSWVQFASVDLFQDSDRIGNFQLFSGAVLSALVRAPSVHEIDYACTVWPSFIGSVIDGYPIYAQIFSYPVNNPFFFMPTLTKLQDFNFLQQEAILHQQLLRVYDKETRESEPVNQSQVHHHHHHHRHDSISYESDTSMDSLLDDEQSLHQDAVALLQFHHSPRANPTSSFIPEHVPENNLEPLMNSHPKTLLQWLRSQSLSNHYIIPCQNNSNNNIILFEPKTCADILTELQSSASNSTFFRCFSNGSSVQNRYRRKPSLDVISRHLKGNELDNVHVFEMCQFIKNRKFQQQDSFSEESEITTILIPVFLTTDRCIILELDCSTKRCTVWNAGKEKNCYTDTNRKDNIGRKLRSTSIKEKQKEKTKPEDEHDTLVKEFIFCCRRFMVDSIYVESWDVKCTMFPTFEPHVNATLWIELFLLEQKSTTIEQSLKDIILTHQISTPLFNQCAQLGINFDTDMLHSYTLSIINSAFPIIATMRFLKNHKIASSQESLFQFTCRIFSLVRFPLHYYLKCKSTDLGDLFTTLINESELPDTKMICQLTESKNIFRLQRTGEREEKQRMNLENELERWLKQVDNTSKNILPVYFSRWLKMISLALSITQGQVGIEVNDKSSSKLLSGCQLLIQQATLQDEDDDPEEAYLVSSRKRKFSSKTIMNKRTKNEYALQLDQLNEMCETLLRELYNAVGQKQLVEQLLSICEGNKPDVLINHRQFMNAMQALEKKVESIWPSFSPCSDDESRRACVAFHLRELYQTLNLKEPVITTEPEESPLKLRPMRIEQHVSRFSQIVSLSNQ